MNAESLGRFKIQQTKIHSDLLIIVPVSALAAHVRVAEHPPGKHYPCDPTR